MKYTRFQSPFLILFENAELMNVYQSEQGKHNYYGVLKVDSEKLKMLNDFLKKYNIYKFNNNIIKFKFPTHYGRPKYKAIGINGLPTVASVIECGIVDCKIKIEGVIDNKDVVLQCDTLIMKT